MRRMRGSVMPMPRADSTVASSTWRTPVNVNVKIGGTASSTRAMITGSVAEPEPDHADHDHRERRDRAPDVGEC